MLNGPHIIVITTPGLLSLKLELQEDKLVKFDLIPWLLSDVYFSVNSSVPFISALTQSNKGLIFGGLSVFFDAKTVPQGF